MKLKLSAVAIVGATALALSACGGAATPATSTSAGSSTAAAPATGELRVWLVGTDTPQDARDYLIKTFEEKNAGSKLVIEEQQWTGLVDKLTTSLSSNDSPDIVEMGNTQAAAFTSAGALVDLTADKATFGGDDLLPGFVEAGTYEGKLYALPYYSGSRVVFYNTDQYKEAGIKVPTTLDEYVSNAVTAQSKLDGVGGVWFPGKDWYNALPFIWENGGNIAVEGSDGTWDAQFSSAESLAGIAQVQELMTKGTNAPKDGDETESWVPFRTEKVTTLSVPSWGYWSIVADEDQKETALTDSLGYFALPGKDGSKPASVFAGGSNIGISARSANPELAKSALEIIMSDEYQTILAKAGLVPAKTTLGGQVAAATPELAKVIAEAAANAKLTPASPNWAEVEASGLLQDFFVKIASGGDAATLAAELDTKIEGILNA